ncbi:hypothetical protein L1887_20395 [Cichorium endivia]|nr:hypothetical protein L1887_20395 [Cichorium endivia]
MTVCRGTLSSDIRAAAYRHKPSVDLFGLRFDKTSRKNLRRRICHVLPEAESYKIHLPLCGKVKILNACAYIVSWGRKQRILSKIHCCYSTITLVMVTLVVYNGTTEVVPLARRAFGHGKGRYRTSCQCLLALLKYHQKSHSIAMSHSFINQALLAPNRIR